MMDEAVSHYLKGGYTVLALAVRKRVIRNE